MRDFPRGFFLSRLLVGILVASASSKAIARVGAIADRLISGIRAEQEVKKLLASGKRCRQSQSGRRVPVRSRSQSSTSGRLA